MTNQTFKCDICGRSYARYNSLVRHSHIHKNTQRHECKDCGVSFYRKDLLSRHEKLHQGELEISANEHEHSSQLQPKRIRRQRCHTACQACRELRTKCCGFDPCTACVESGRECRYDSTSRRKSRPSRVSDLVAGEKETTNWCGNDDFADNNMAPIHRNNMTVSTQDHSMDQAVLQNHPLELVTQTPSLPVLPANNEVTVQTDLCESNAESESGQFFPHDLAFDYSILEHISWSSLHESLYLTDHHDEFFDYGNYQTIANTNPPQVSLEAAQADQSLTLNDMPKQYNTKLPNVARKPVENQEIMLNGNTLLLHSPNQSQLERQTGLVQDLISFASTSNSKLGNFSTVIPYLKDMSSKLVEAFGITITELSSTLPLLDHYIELYLTYFEPLWPLFSQQNFDMHGLHPLLYLVLTSIGAQYADAGSAQYGALMHNNIRVCLAAPIDLDGGEDDYLWLAQARVHSQVSALYFAQPKAFSYAQHLGAILVGQARRINLFSGDIVNECLRRFKGEQHADSDQARLAMWLHAESRRMLAFAIFRAETYTSVLLQKKAMISLEEIDLSFPSCEAVWQGSRMPVQACLQIVQHDRTPTRDLTASDLYRIALDRNESLPSLDPMAYELLLFGLQWPVWLIRRDPDTVVRLARRPVVLSDVDSDSVLYQEAASQSLYDGTPSIETIFSVVDDTMSDLDRLDNPPRQMTDLQGDYMRVVNALKKCQNMLPMVKSSVTTPRDRARLMSALIMYHLAHMLLRAPMEDLHQIHYRLADKKTVDLDALLKVRKWGATPSAKVAAERAVSLWSLISSSAAKAKTSSGFQFNLLAFIALHHAAALLWAYSGAQEPTNGRNDLTDEEGVFFITSDGTVSLKVNRDNIERILNSFSIVFHSLSSSRWTSFAKAVNTLSTLRFPEMNRS